MFNTLHLYKISLAQSQERTPRKGSLTLRGTKDWDVSLKHNDGSRVLLFFNLGYSLVINSPCFQACLLHEAKGNQARPILIEHQTPFSEVHWWTCATLCWLSSSRAPIQLNAKFKKICTSSHPVLPKLLHHGPTPGGNQKWVCFTASPNSLITSNRSKQKVR